MANLDVPDIDEMLAAITTQLRDQFHPEKVILFGSRARHEERPDSDVDLLVVMAAKDKGVATREIKNALGNQPLPIDVVVCLPQEFHRYRDVPGTVIMPAWREGRYLHGEPEAWVVRQDSPPYGEIAKPMAKRADDDLKAALILLGSEDEDVLDGVCFHAQQYAEKGIKAALINRGIDPVRTHDLVLLAAQLPAPMRARLIPEELKMLSSYAVETRYGLTAQCPDRPTAVLAVEASRRVQAVVALAD